MTQHLFTDRLAMRSTSRRMFALLAVLVAGCARTTEEWAADVVKWDPFRRDVAIAALGRVPRSDVDVAARALLRLLTFKDDTARARFVDSLQRLCRADFDAVVRVCAETSLNHEMTKLVMGAVKSSSVASAPFLRYLVTSDAAGVDLIGAYLPEIRDPEAQTLTELFIAGSPGERLRALEILAHTSLLESQRLGRLSETAIQNVKLALQRVIDDSRKSAVVGEELQCELRIRATLELIATGVVPIRSATEFTPDELICLMKLCGEKIGRLAHLSSYVVQYISVAPAPGARENSVGGSVGIDTFLDARESSRAEERALALLAFARSGAAVEEIRVGALAALEADEVPSRLAGLLALARIVRPGESVPSRVSVLAATDPSTAVREAASTVSARAEVAPRTPD